MYFKSRYICNKMKIGGEIGKVYHAIFSESLPKTIEYYLTRHLVQMLYFLLWLNLSHNWEVTACDKQIYRTINMWNGFEILPIRFFLLLYIFWQNVIWLKDSPVSITISGQRSILTGHMRHKNLIPAIYTAVMLSLIFGRSTLDWPNINRDSWYVK